MRKIEKEKPSDTTTIIYPYDPEDIIEIFREGEEKVYGNFEKKFESYESAKSILKENLAEMSTFCEQSYDFKYIEWTFHEKGTSQEVEAHSTEKSYYSIEDSVSRRIYVKASCEGKRDRRGRPHPPFEWTSHFGLAKISYAIVDLKEFLTKYPKYRSETETPEQEVKDMKFPKIVLWSLRIYKFICSKCSQESKVKIESNHMKGLSKIFCRSLAYSFCNLKLKLNKKDYNDRGNVFTSSAHRMDYCIACIEKVCKYNKAERKKQLKYLEKNDPGEYMQQRRIYVSKEKTKTLPQPKYQEKKRESSKVLEKEQLSDFAKLVRFVDQSKNHR